MTEEVKADELTIQDLAMARAVIELATERGVFKAGELASVGGLYNKLDAFLKHVEAQAKANQQGTAAAQTPPNQTVEEENADA
jgi:hypothetical protein